MVPLVMCMRALTSPAGRGPPAPSMTARAFRAACERPWPRAMPPTTPSTSTPTVTSSRITRAATHEAPGYSRSKAAASASGDRPVRSGLDGDLDAGRQVHAGPPHGVAQLGVAGEALGLVERGEAV